MDRLRRGGNSPEQNHPWSVGFNEVEQACFRQGMRVGAGKRHVPSLLQLLYHDCNHVSGRSCRGGCAILVFAASGSARAGKRAMKLPGASVLCAPTAGAWR